jgi:hypothetical protein
MHFLVVIEKEYDLIAKRNTELGKQLYDRTMEHDFLTKKTDKQNRVFNFLFFIYIRN